MPDSAPAVASSYHLCRKASDPFNDDGQQIHRFRSFRPGWRLLADNLIAATILTFARFFGVILEVIVPTMKKNVIGRKKQTICEGPQAAWSGLAGKQKQDQQGAILHAAVRSAVSTRIRHAAGAGAAFCRHKTNASAAMKNFGALRPLAGRDVATILASTDAPPDQVSRAVVRSVLELLLARLRPSA